MRSYVATTGVAFGLLVLVHVVRVVVEGGHPIREPLFLFSTVASACLCSWAIVLLLKSARE